MDEPKNQAHSLPGDALREALECARDTLGYIFETSDDHHCAMKAENAWRQLDAALTPSALSGDAGEGETCAALETLIRKTRIQATCLEHYAEQSGFSAGPIPSVFHLQAAHFRTFTDEAAAALTPSATISEPSNWVTTVICATCGGEFDEGEWDADTRCPECEEPKRWNEKRTKLLAALPSHQGAGE